MKVEGRCLCGAVTVVVTGAHGDISACHCRMCTRWSGSVHMGIEVVRERVAIDGPVKTYQSSSIAQRAWCDRCGSALWFADTEGCGAASFELAPGLFDNAGGAWLTGIVYADCSPSGYAIAGDIQRVTKADYEASHMFVEDGV